MKTILRAAIPLAIVAAMGAMSQAANAADPIRFGVVVPLSGPVAVSGVPEKQAIDLLTDVVNAKGGILGRKLEVVTYDDQAQSKKPPISSSG